MSKIPQLSRLGADSHGQEATNWNKCILCQSDDPTKGPMVSDPRLTSYQKVLDAVHERAILYDGDYVEVQRRLKHNTKETLCEQKVSWHRSCYASATNHSHIKRAQDRHEHALPTGSYPVKKRGQKRGSTEIDEAGPSTSGWSPTFTWSCTVPLDKAQCFFCQEDNGQQLFKVCSNNSGEALKAAVEMSHNEALKTRLNTSISSTDAHAIDVRYHKSCWTKHVFHARRDGADTRITPEQRLMQAGCLIELMNLIELQTQNKAYLSMDEIEKTYVNMLGEECLKNHSPAFSRKWLKEKILAELPTVKSVLPKNRRKPAILYSPDACEEDMVHSSITSDNDMDNMKTIFKAAKTIRKSIADFKKNSANVMSVSSNISDVPVELYTMLRWIIVGPVDELETEARTTAVDRMVLTVSQNILYGFKSSRQVKYKAASRDLATFRHQHARENPQVLGLALTVHHDTRNKKLMDLLNAQGYCVPHVRTLRLETALTNTCCFFAVWVYKR